MTLINELLRWVRRSLWPQAEKSSSSRVTSLAESEVKEKLQNRLNPQCFDPDQSICLSSGGFFTPCCWFDDELYKSQYWVSTFFRDHLDIEKNESVEDIFNSPEWKSFFDMLINNPSDAPPICHKMCGHQLEPERYLEKGSLADDHTVSLRIHH